MKHLEIKIFGRVQGINFRTQASEKAAALGINGFVRNQSDGSVLIEAEGEEGPLDELAAWCRKGPRFSKVERLEVVEGGMKGYNDFAIKS